MIISIILQVVGVIPRVTYVAGDQLGTVVITRPNLIG